MGYRIKGWEKFQHFKDRRPPWIKLYREILDDPDWHDLDGDTAKALVSFWLIASEDETQEGRLPDARRLAFRLRTTEVKVNQLLNKLSHWLIQDDINTISERCQSDAPETETETETEIETEHSATDVAGGIYSKAFLSFWDMYPNRKNKGAAFKAFKKIKPAEYPAVKDGLTAKKKSDDWLKDNGKFIPHPASWLNARGWEDETTSEPIMLVCPNGFPFSDWMKANQQEKSEIMQRHG